MVFVLNELKIQDRKNRQIPDIKKRTEVRHENKVLHRNIVSDNARRLLPECTGLR
jgi:hypothetical protein